MWHVGQHCKYALWNVFHIKIKVLLYFFFPCMYIYIFKPPRVLHSTSRLMSHERIYCTVGYVFFQEKMNHVYEHHVNDICFLVLQKFLLVSG